MSRLHAAWHRTVKAHRQRAFHPHLVFGWMPVLTITECECGRRWEW